MPYEPKEEYIEADILDFLTIQKVLCWKNDIKGYFNEKQWRYQRNKSNFIRRGISDVSAIIEWRHFAIEVKKPSEMAFFDKPLKELKEQFAIVLRSNLKSSTLKKYQHAIEQREFLDDVIKAWWVWFFVSSLDELVRNLRKNGYRIH